MPRPSERTRSRKRIHKSFPGSGYGTHYRVEASAIQRCYICNRPLTGLPAISKSKASKLSRGQKRVARPFGGQMCSDCLKRNLKQAARSI